MTKATYVYQPDYAVLPGEILVEHLEALQMSQAELARRCNRSSKLISEIISGKAPIEPATAVHLEKALGLDARIWLGIEADYRLHLQRQEEAQEAENQQAWAKSFPVSELVKRGVMSKPASKAEKVGAVLRFFGVGSIDAWEATYGENLLSNVAFRHSPSYGSDRFALATWLRLGEIEAEGIATQPYDKPTFLKALTEIRSLTAAQSTESLETTQRLCSEAGVALAIVKPLPGTSLHAATRWLSPKKALIQLTARYMRDDQLWFSLFHESAHVLLHGKRQMFVRTKDKQDTEEEEQADRWAANFLISPKDWRTFSDACEFTAGDVAAFADKQGVSPGIVVGRLQHEERINWSNLNNLKATLEWKA